MNNYPEFSEAIRVGKDTANKRVERLLYERANGYSYDAVKIFMPAGSKQPVVVHYVERCPPEVAAAFIWLKNRDPERWRDVQNVEHVLGKYLISDHPLTEEEWARDAVLSLDENHPALNCAQQRRKKTHRRFRMPMLASRKPQQDGFNSTESFQYT
jgi:hypothetical protein